MRGGGASVPTAPPQAVASAFALAVFFAFVPEVVVFCAALAAVSAVLRCAAVCAPNFFVNRSTRPSVSISFWRPVKNGWQAEQISRCSSGLVERVLNVLPHAQRTSTSAYLGWMPSFTVSFLRPSTRFARSGQAPQLTLLARGRPLSRFPAGARNTHYTYPFRLHSAGQGFSGIHRSCDETTVGVPTKSASTARPSSRVSAWPKSEGRQVRDTSVSKTMRDSPEGIS